IWRKSRRSGAAWRASGRWSTAASRPAPRIEPLVHLGDHREVPLDAIEALLEGLSPVELAARDSDPHAVRRVHDQVRRRRLAGEAPAPAALDADVVLAR